MNIARSSIIVTIFTIIGLGLGLFSNIVVAMKFGARTDMDIFLAATTVPLFIISIISGALNFTFIPVFAEYRARGQVEAWKVVSSFINLSLIVSIVLCIAGMAMAEQITRIIVPGFSRNQVVHTTALLRWLLPLIVFTVMNELMASVYYSDNRFVVPSLNKVVSPIITIVYVILFHESLSTKSLALAMLTAALLQATLLATGFLKRQDYHYSFLLDYRHPGVRKILKLMIPLISGMIVYRAVPVFDRYFLSVLPTGSISHIDYAMKFINLIPAVIVSGITISIFPNMAKYSAEDNIHELKSLISKGLRMLFFLSVPAAIFLGIFGKPLIRLAFERGAFVASDTSAVYHAFSLYSMALPAMVIGVVIGQGYYVLKDTMTVAVIGVGEMMIYVVLCYALLQLLGYLAIPMAYAAQFNIGVILSGIILRYKLGNKGGITILRSMGKHLVAALVPLTIFLLFFRSNMSDAIMTMVLIPMCFIAYLLISRFVFLTEEAVRICEIMMDVFRKKGKNGTYQVHD
jgi:putative peptidoglycan lipid II flippase